MVAAAILSTVVKGVWASTLIERDWPLRPDQIVGGEGSSRSACFRKGFSISGA